MADNSSSNKRIAKNTLLLYVRMFLLLGVSLYTSRIVLATLGIEDYGLYNVVGGVVSMFTFVSMAMGNSTNRYITFALGKGDKHDLRMVVSGACVIHWALAILIFLFAETIGLWFLHNKMVIPEGRMMAAEWVYQFSIIACMVSIVSVPYNAMIIAHEKMGAFAFMSILDAVLKLLIVYLMQIAGYDKLIFYAALILCVYVMDRVVYQIYCRRHFEEAKKITFTTKLPQFKEMTSFAGWSMIGNLIFLGYTHGINILLNIFFGPSVNAARGVAFQVQGAMKGFVTNFQMALNPQIIKSYAQKDYKRQIQLVFYSSKFSYFLTLCMVLPVFIEADEILNLWLKEVPAYSVEFLRIILLISLVSPLENPIGVSNDATGDVKIYQIIVGCFNIFIIIFAYVVLMLGLEPYAVFIVQWIISSIVLFVKIFLVKRKINELSFKEYFQKVLIRIGIVTIIAAAIPMVVHYIIQAKSIFLIILNCILSIVSAVSSSFLIGMTNHERTFLTGWLKSIFKNRLYN